MIKKCLFLLVLFYGSSIGAFYTLTSAQQYAQGLVEFPKIDQGNYNWLNPSYEIVHKQFAPSYFKRFFNFFGMRRKTWDDEIFIDVLTKVTQQRLSLFVSETLFVDKITATPLSKFYIWGSLNGALHSFMRSLEWLKNEKIINDDFLIIDPNAYFIFNGDVIGRSPYNLETLTVVMQLLRKNPERVIYIAGQQEQKGYWQNFGTRTELGVKIAGTNARLPEYEKLLKNFFATLPIAIFINTVNDPKACIRISYIGRTGVIPDYTMPELVTDQPINKIIHIPLPRTTTASPKLLTGIDVKAIIKSEEKMKERVATQGLNILDQDYGANSWSVFSAPIPVYVQYYDFHYDAFAELTIDAEIADSSLTLINRDILTQEPFKRSVTYSVVLTGVIPSKDKQEIRFGSTMSLVQGTPYIGRQLRRGILARLRQERRIDKNGRWVRLYIYNDDYTTYKAKNNIEKIKKLNSTDMIFMSQGSPTLLSYIDQVRDLSVAVYFPFTGASRFRDKSIEGIVNLTASYDDEVRALLTYMLDEQSLGIQKIALFYQDDAYGIGPKDAAHEFLKKYNNIQIIDVPYTRIGVNFQKQVKLILENQPDAIGLFSTAQSTQEFLRQLGIENIANKKLFGISPLDEESFRFYSNKLGIPIYLAAIVPNPDASNLPIVKLYRKAMDELKYPYDIVSLQGYIATTILIESIKTIEGSVDKYSLLDALKKFNQNVGGLSLSFDQNTRSLLNSVWVKTGTTKEWREFKLDELRTSKS